MQSVFSFEKFKTPFDIFYSRKVDSKTVLFAPNVAWIKYIVTLIFLHLLATWFFEGLNVNSRVCKKPH